MRKIFVFIIGIACLSLSATLSIGDIDCTNSQLTYVLPDSIALLLQNQPSLFYSYGHYGYSWSIITVVNHDFRTYSGRVSYIGEKAITSTRTEDKFDSTLFFNNNKRLLLWALDTMPFTAQKMTPIYGSHTNSMYTELTIYRPKSKDSFHVDNNVICFAGPDSVVFNHNYHRLCLILRWLSAPNMRKYILDSLIYHQT